MVQWIPPASEADRGRSLQKLSLDIAIMFELYESVGKRQAEILIEARENPNGIMVDQRRNNARWCAVKRLLERGLLSRHHHGSGKYGPLVVYRATTAGRETWLRVR